MTETATKLPAPPDAPPAPSHDQPRLGRFVLGALLILLGIGWLLEVLDIVAVPWGSTLPALLIVIGMTLVLGAWSGRHGGLVVLGILITVVLTFSSTLNVSFVGGVGERIERPLTAAVLRSEYRLAMGTMTLDLSGVALPYGTTSIEASVGMGELVVRVPADAGVRIVGETGAGELVALGEVRDGLGVNAVVETPGYDGAQRRLSLRLSVGAGRIHVEEAAS